MITMDELNQMDRASFTNTLASIFEHSSWVARRAFDARPFTGLDALHGAMIAAVESAAGDEKLALLRAHPDLGTRARLSDASASEQSGVGLDQLTASEFLSFTTLTEAYKEKYGFPFIYAVRGSTKHDILRALQLRSGGPVEQEFVEALGQVYRIARFRLQDLLGER